MSDPSPDFKYEIDIAKIKSSKLFQKFVKEIEQPNTKREDPQIRVTAPNFAVGEGKVIDYQVSFQKRQQPFPNVGRTENDRATVAKQETMSVSSSSTPKPQEPREPIYLNNNAIRNSASNSKSSSQQRPLPVGGLNPFQINNSNPPSIAQVHTYSTVQTQSAIYQSRNNAEDSSFTNERPVERQAPPVVNQARPQRNREGRMRGQFSQHAQMVQQSQSQQPQSSTVLPVQNTHFVQSFQIKEKIHLQNNNPSQFTSFPTPTSVASYNTIHPANLSYSSPPVQLDTSMALMGMQDYKVKYEKLTQAFQEFKIICAQQNRQKKSEILDYQTKYQELKQKIYQFQTSDDQLRMENGKLKQKLNTETILRTRLEEENKELNYRIQELQEQLENRDDALRKRTDETNHLKTQSENMKAQIQNVRLTNQKLSIAVREYEQEQEYLKREKQNKDSLQMDMKEKVTSLIRQNAKLKDQLHFTTSRLIQLEHENYSLKTDLNRENNANTHNTYGGDNGLSSFNLRSEQTVPNNYYNQRMPSQSVQETSISYEQAPQQKAPRRRGEFNREREKLNENSSTAQVQREQVSNVSMGGPSRPAASHAPGSSFNTRSQHQNTKRNQEAELLSKKDVLQKRLQKNRGEKAVTGAIRKERIEIQRELESIHIKLSELRGTEK